jgi:hypothetical protein
MSDPKEEQQQQNLGAFLFLLALILFGVFSIYLWFS